MNHQRRNSKKTHNTRCKILARTRTQAHPHEMKAFIHEKMLPVATFLRNGAWHSRRVAGDPSASPNVCCLAHLTLHSELCISSSIHVELLVHNDVHRIGHEPLSLLLRDLRFLLTRLEPLVAAHDEADAVQVTLVGVLCTDGLS